MNHQVHENRLEYGAKEWSILTFKASKKLKLELCQRMRFIVGDWITLRTNLTSKPEISCNAWIWMLEQLPVSYWYIHHGLTNHQNSSQNGTKPPMIGVNENEETGISHPWVFIRSIEAGIQYLCQSLDLYSISTTKIHSLHLQYFR